MNEKERIKHIKDQIKKDDICILYSSMDKPFSNPNKYFSIGKQTAKELIKTIHIAQNEGYGYDRVQKLLDELEAWVKE